MRIISRLSRLHLTLRIVLFASLLLLSLLTGHAQKSQSDNPKTRSSKNATKGEASRNGTLYSGSFALLIGASDYDNNEAWDDLPGVARDMDAVKAALEANGFVVEQVINPTRKQYREALDSFIERYGFRPDNRLLVYHAGHGTKRTLKDGREVGYLVMKDSPANPGMHENAEEFLRSAVAFDEIDGYSRRITAKHVMFVFDTCNSGFLLQKTRDKPKQDDFVLDVLMQPVRFYLTAGNASQKVWDESQFRRRFIRGINGEADRNNDKFVQGTELGLYLSENVYRDTGKRQTPLFDKIESAWLSRGDFLFPITPENQRMTIAEVLRAADSAWRKGDIPTLERQAQLALRMEPQNPLAHLYVLLAYLVNNWWLLVDDLKDAEIAKEAKAMLEAEADEILSLVPRPNSAEEFLAKGLAWIVKGENERASQAIAKSIDLDPTNPNTYLARIVVISNLSSSYTDLSSDKADEVIASLNQIIKIDPSFTHAYLLRVIILMNNKSEEEEQSEKALTDCTEWLKLGGTRWVLDFLFRLGKSFISSPEKWGLDKDDVQDLANDLANTDDAKTLQLISKFVHETQSAPSAYAYVLRSFFWDDTKRTIADLTKAIELDQDNAFFYSCRGNTYFDDEKYEQAISDYSEAIKIDAKTVGHYADRAKAYIKKKDKEKALKDLDKVVALTPFDTDSYRERFNYYADLGEKEYALEDLAKIISLTPDRWKSYYERYEYYGKLGEDKLAIDDITKAIEIHPKESDKNKESLSGLFNQRHSVYLKTGNYRAALDDFAKTLDLHPRKTAKDKTELSKRYFDYSRKLIIYGLYEKVPTVISQGEFYCLDEPCRSAYTELQERYQKLKELNDAIVSTDANSSNPGQTKWKLFEQRAELYKYLSSKYFFRFRPDGKYTSFDLTSKEMEGSRKAVNDLKYAIENCQDGDAKLKLYINRGELFGDYDQLGDYQSAISNYSDAITAFPGNATFLMDLYQRRSRLYSIEKDYPKALADINQALALDKGADPGQTAGLYDNRGSINSESGNDEQAVKDHTVAIEKYPALSQYYLERRAKAWQKLGKAEEAKKDELKIAEIKLKEDEEKKERERKEKEKPKKP